MHNAVRRGAAATAAALLVLTPVAPAVAKGPKRAKTVVVEAPLQVEVDRPYVMLGDAVELEAKYKVKVAETDDTDDSDDSSDDDTTTDTTVDDGPEAEDPTDDSPVVGMGAAPVVAALPSTVSFTVDYGDGTTVGELVIDEIEVDDEEFEAEAEASHRYEAVGQYTVVVTATPDVGPAEVQEVVVNVTTEPVPYPRRGKDACPEAGIPASTFADLPATSKHKRSVDCVSAWGLVSGKTSESFAPGQQVSREQLATLLVRMIERAGVTLPAGTDLFDDDDRSVHEDNIDKLAAAGLVNGTGADTFRPGAPVTRAQMASLLVRVYEHLSDEELAAVLDYFGDDDADVHQANINRSAAAGFTSGKALGSYAPGGHVTREQIATFLMRTLDRLVAVDGVTF